MLESEFHKALNDVTPSAIGRDSPREVTLSELRFANALVAYAKIVSQPRIVGVGVREPARRVPRGLKRLHGGAERAGRLLDVAEFDPRPDAIGLDLQQPPQRRLRGGVVVADPLGRGLFSEKRNESLAAGLLFLGDLGVEQRRRADHVEPTRLLARRADGRVDVGSLVGRWRRFGGPRPRLLHGSPEALGHPGYRNGLLAQSLEQLGRVLGLHCKLQSGTVKFGQLQISTDRRSGNDRGFVQRRFSIIRAELGQGEEPRQLLSAPDENRRAARAPVGPIRGEIVSGELAQAPRVLASADLRIDIPVGDRGRIGLFPADQSDVSVSVADLEPLVGRGAQAH